MDPCRDMSKYLTLHQYACVQVILACAKSEKRKKEIVSQLIAKVGEKNFHLIPTTINGTNMRTAIQHRYAIAYMLHEEVPNKCLSPGELIHDFALSSTLFLSEAVKDKHIDLKWQEIVNGMEEDGDTATQQEKKKLGYFSNGDLIYRNVYTLLNLKDDVLVDLFSRIDACVSISTWYYLQDILKDEARIRNVASKVMEKMLEKRLLSEAMLFFAHTKLDFIPIIDVRLVDASRKSDEDVLKKLVNSLKDASKMKQTYVFSDWITHNEETEHKLQEEVILKKCVKHTRFNTDSYFAMDANLLSFLPNIVKNPDAFAAWKFLKGKTNYLVMTNSKEDQNEVEMRLIRKAKRNSDLKDFPWFSKSLLNHVNDDFDVLLNTMKQQDKLQEICLQSNLDFEKLTTGVLPYLLHHRNEEPKAQHAPSLFIPNSNEFDFFEQWLLHSP